MNWVISDEGGAHQLPLGWNPSITTGGITVHLLPTSTGLVGCIQADYINKTLQLRVQS